MLSHITILRKISRDRNEGYSLVIDNNKYNFKSVFENNVIKLFKFLEIVSYKTEYHNSTCYLINRTGAKILIFAYIICINRIYI